VSAKHDEQATKWGFLSTGFELSVAVSKLCGGLLLGRIAPAKLVGRILFSVAVCNTGLFALQAASAAVAFYPSLILWAFHGLAQGLGWGALVGAFVAAFPNPAERGSRYAILSGSQNVGAASVALFLLPLSKSMLLAGDTASLKHGQWRALQISLLLPAALCAVGAVLLPKVITAAAPSAAIAPNSTSSQQVSGQGVHPPSTNWTTPLLLTIQDPRQVCIAASYFCLSTVRNAVAMWALQFVPIISGSTLNAQTIGLALAAMEGGGFLGGVIAGAVSDVVFTGRRGPVMVLSCALSAAVLVCLTALPAAAAGFEGGQLLSAQFVLIGGGSFAAHVLAGLLAREIAPPSSREVAGGMVKAVAQLGSAVGAAPFAALAGSVGWRVAVLVLAGLMGAASLFALPLWNVRPAAEGGAGQDKQK